jgi:hypothetical protein
VEVVDGAVKVHTAGLGGGGWLQFWSLCLLSKAVRPGCVGSITIKMVNGCV